MAARVRTPSRLHFGLLGWGPGAPRQFGGMGLMIDDPGLEVRVRAAPDWAASGPLASRALETARGVAGRLAAEGRIPPPCAVEVVSAPPEHCGLGVGTQLSLAIAGALVAIAGGPAPDAGRLAALTGRGRRSGVGLHGFLHGGLIVDGGRGPGSSYPPLLARLAPPDSWRVLVAIPPTGPKVHGAGEARAFQALPDVPGEVGDRLCRLVLLGALPAVAEGDLPAFGRALRAIQESVGACFATVQGGTYASPLVARIIDVLDTLGLHGAGQSSWGPAVYGFSDAPGPERDEIRGRVARAFEGLPLTLFWSRPCLSGATLSAD